MRSVLSRYSQIERHIWHLLLAELFIQLVNSSFFLLLNYYMLKEGYADYTIAKFVKVRFLAVMMLAFPIGLFLKGKKLKPVFTTGIIMMPLMSLLVIYAVQAHNPVLLYTGFIMWGISFSLVQITALPYVVLNADQETHSEIFALFFQTWAVGTVIVGLTNYLLNNYAGLNFDEKNLLLMFSCLGLIGSLFALTIRKKEEIGDPIHILDSWKAYDWHLIRQAVLPNLIIAVGAGFTIPFVNLFFESVHGIDSDAFSLMGASTYIIVSIGVFFIPAIKRRFGYGIAITLFQSMAVIALIFLATTEWYAGMGIAVFVAIFFYILRQPLMNIASPMTSELSLYYVGRKNRELVAALNSSVWSGSWFFSASMFQYLRQWEVPYSTIFLITAALYALGVFWYHLLIRKYQRRLEAGEIDS